MLNVKLNRDPITRSASIAAAIVLAAVTVLVAGFGVSAQSPFATVSGSASDQNGRPIAGVRLVLSNAAAQTKNEVKSDAAGHYEFVGVPAGSYELLFEFTGMASIKREGLTVAGGQAARINAAMQIGSIEETIHVSAGDSRPLGRGYPNARANEKPDPCAASASGGCVRPPLKIRDVRPVFPAGSAGGTVELVGRIDANGLMTELEVRSSPDRALSNAALDAVNGWEFLPTHLDGEPIDTRINVHVTFMAAK